MGQTNSRRAQARSNKAPDVTAFFWTIVVLAAAVGETAANLLSTRLGLGLTNSAYLTAFLYGVALVYQLASRRYVPGIYWITILLVSIVGTLVTDNLLDQYGVTLRTTTIVFSGAVAVTFGIWYVMERSLSIKAIDTTRREAFAWMAILLTFALGTAAGDLVAESLGVGYWASALLFAGAVSLVAIASSRFGLNAIVAFWAVLVLARPLGASLGDYVSQPRADGGLAWGPTSTTIGFLVAIAILVVTLATSSGGSDGGAGTRWQAGRARWR